MGKPTRMGLHFTRDHEWIDFQGSIAYIGVGAFKLLGFRDIHEIVYSDLSGIKKSGDLVATIRYKDYKIKACMPVAGKILELNYALLNGDKKILLQHSETKGWIAIISPSFPYDRYGLLIPKKYLSGGKIEINN